MILSLQQLAFVIHRQIYQLFFFGFSTLFHIWFREGEDSCRISIIFWRKKKNRCQCFASFQKTRNVSPTRCAVLSPLFGWNLPNNSSGDCALWMEMLWHCVTHPGSCFSPFQISELKIYTAVAIQSGKRKVYLLSIRTWYLSLSVSTEMAFHGSSMAVPWPVEMKPNRLLLLLLLSRSCSTTVQHWIFNLENDRFRFIDAAPLWDPLFCWHTNNAPWPIYEKLTDFISIFLFVSSLLLSFFCFCFKLPTGKVLFNHLLTGSGNMLTRFLKFPVFEAVAVRDRSRIIALYRWSVESGPILIVWF